jgi:hypothetical protein
MLDISRPDLALAIVTMDRQDIFRLIEFVLIRRPRVYSGDIGNRLPQGVGR